MIPERLKQFSFVLCDKEKSPIHEGWTEKIIKADTPELMAHIEKGGNYGVICGKKSLIEIKGKTYYLMVLDFDKKELQDKVVPLLPETFTTTSGSPKQCFHLWFATDGDKSYKIQDKQMETLADVQGTGKQVIAPGSKHKSGSTYSVLKDIDFAYILYSELKAILMQYDEKPQKIQRPVKISAPRGTNKDVVSAMIDKVSMNRVLTEIGININKNPSNCFRHNSVGGKCFSWNEVTGHCFHCDGSWNKYSLIRDGKNISDKETINWFSVEAGMQTELELSRQEFKEQKRKEAINNITTTTSQNNLKAQYLALVNQNFKDYATATELLVEYIKKRQPLKTTKVDEKNEIYAYKDGVWIPNGRSEIKEMLRNILQEQYSNYVYNLVEIKIEADTFITPQEFFNALNSQKQKNLIPVLNGVLNIRTRELLPFSQEYFFLSRMGVAYIPGVSCPNIKKYLEEVLGNPEDISVMYEVVGFCLKNEYTHEKAFMFLGNGRNGKGKWIETIKRFLGAENCSCLPLSGLVAESFMLCNLMGKYANLAGDISNTDLKNTGMFKSLTGRDYITANRKFLQPIQFTNFAKMIFACNELPMVWDTSAGFWSRWVLLEFPYEFMPADKYEQSQEKFNPISKQGRVKLQNPNIIDTITTPEELSGLLNAALDGLDRLEARNDFSSTKGTEQIKKTWIVKSNSCLAFILDCVEEDANGAISKQKLWKEYKDYCAKHNVPTKSAKMMATTLQNEIGVEQQYNTNAFGIREYTWHGISFRGKI